LPGQRGPERREVETRELNVKLGKPLRIVEGAGSDSRLYRLGHLQVQPIEPFQARPHPPSGVDGVKNPENIRDGLRRGPDRGDECGIVRNMVHCMSGPEPVNQNFRRN